MISMKSISSSDKNYLSEKHNLLVFGLFMDDKNKFKQTELDSKLGNIISSTLKLEKFNGDYKRTILLYGNDQYTRILYVGLGDRNDYCTDRSRSLGSILTKLKPEGILKGILFELIFAFSIKSLNIGTATEEPVCLKPKFFGLSKPT